MIHLTWNNQHTTWQWKTPELRHDEPLQSFTQITHSISAFFFSEDSLSISVTLKARYLISFFLRHTDKRKRPFTSRIVTAHFCKKYVVEGRRSPQEFSFHVRGMCTVVISGLDRNGVAILQKLWKFLNFKRIPVPGFLPYFLRKTGPTHRNYYFRNPSSRFRRIYFLAKPRSSRGIVTFCRKQEGSKVTNLQRRGYEREAGRDAIWFIFIVAVFKRAAPGQIKKTL